MVIGLAVYTFAVFCSSSHTILVSCYDVTKDIKSAQAAAGHTTAAMTLKYYVKGRETSQDTASPIVKAYGIDG